MTNIIKSFYKIVISHYKEVEQEKGDPKTKKFTESFLTSAVNYTDAEEKGNKYAEQNSLKNFNVTSITKTKIENVFNDNEHVDNMYFELKMAYEYEDDKGNTKRNYSQYLVETSSIDSLMSYSKDKEKFDNMIVVKAEESKILDII